MNKKYMPLAFMKGEEGAALIIAAFAIPALITLAAIGLEIGRVNYVETQLSYAADAAAIAGARYDVNEVQENASKVFFANFPDNSYGVQVDPQITFDESTNIVHVIVDTYMPTIIGKYVGIPKLRVNAESEVLREFGGLELAMVLDITGSMAWNNKLVGLKDAAKHLVDVIYEGYNTRNNTAISIVPYVASVNIGANNVSWLSNSTKLNLFSDAKVAWEGCIMAQGNGEFDDENIDTPPGATQRWPVYFAESTYDPKNKKVIQDNDWQVVNGVFKIINPVLDGVSGTDPINIGPNRSCSQPMLPLVNNAALVKSTIDQFTPHYGGGTIGNLGLIWGARMLSPSWSGQWSVQQANKTIVNGEPIKGYTQGTNTKAIIIMTDGESQWYNGSLPPNTGDPTSYGAGLNDRFIIGKLGASSISNFTTKINEKILRICTAAKSKGIEVFTVTFGVSSTSPIQNIYKACATAPDHYASANNNAQLKEVFDKIAKQLKRLRIIL